MNVWLLILASCVCSLHAVSIRNPEDEKPTRSVGKACSLRSLPGHITAAKGRLSLIADYRDRRDDHVVLYLVNRTRKRIALPVQDGDVYAKLEGKVEGKWRRAQGHRSSWCGNSYYKLALEPNHFFVFLGYSPAKGRKCSVRYTLFNQPRISSNVGVGFIDPQQVARCRYDALAIGSGNYAFVAPIAEGKQLVGTSTEVFHDSRDRAIYRLGGLGDQKSLSLLEQLARNPKTPTRYFGTSFSALQWAAHPRAIKLYLEVIRDKKHPRRSYLISTTIVRSPAIFKELSKVVDNPHDPVFHRAVALYAPYRTPAVKEKLKALIANKALSQASRARIRRIYYSNFPNTLFKLKVVMENTADRTTSDPVDFSLKFHNRSRKSITLAYRSLTDIIIIVVSKDTRERPLVRPRTKNIGPTKRTTVTVPPGGKVS